MLYRSRKNRVIAGVCGGIAENLKVRAVGIRVIFAILSLFYGLAVVVYVLAWLILRSE